MIKIYSYTDQYGAVIQFLPTDKVVESNYINGRKGDHLWVQVINGFVIANYYTKKEIYSLMNNGYVWDVKTMVESIPWGITNVLFINDEPIKVERIPTKNNAPVARKATKDDVKVSWHHNKGNMHKWSVPFGITKEEACNLQMELGYHPAGYGFYGFDATLSGTTWFCGNSCD